MRSKAGGVAGEKRKASMLTLFSINCSNQEGNQDCDSKLLSDREMEICVISEENREC